MRLWWHRFVSWCAPSLVFYLMVHARSRARQLYWRLGPAAASPPRRVFAQPKPKWVCNEVIRLNAVMPQAGCRTIAYHFNEAKNGVRLTPIFHGRGVKSSNDPATGLQNKGGDGVVA